MQSFTSCLQFFIFLSNTVFQIVHSIPYSDFTDLAGNCGTVITEASTIRLLSDQKENTICNTTILPPNEDSSVIISIILPVHYCRKADIRGITNPIVLQHGDKLLDGCSLAKKNVGQKRQYIREAFDGPVTVFYKRFKTLHLSVNFMPKLLECGSNVQLEWFDVPLLMKTPESGVCEVFVPGAASYFIQIGRDNEKEDSGSYMISAGSTRDSFSYHMGPYDQDLDLDNPCDLGRIQLFSKDLSASFLRLKVIPLAPDHPVMARKCKS